ncbi:MAG: helix-hairpin-helix domain-containing protein [Mariprofundaceae bacterium]
MIKWMVFIIVLLMASPLMAAESIDVNSADATQLTQVKGIGAKTAAAIIAYRVEHGAFKSLDDLVKVKGIGKKKLAKLLPHLTVGGKNPCNPCGAGNPCAAH